MSRRLKVVHVMTSTSGGAGNAAMRIHRAVSPLCESSVVCLYPGGAESDRNVHAIPVRLPRFWERAAMRAGMPLNRDDRIAARRDEFGIRGISFSEPASSYDIASHPLVRVADVVHLHWVGGLLDWETFFERVNKPIAWTLHDLNPTLGGFHYLTDRERSNAAAQTWDVELQTRKANVLEEFRRLRIIGPSSWIAQVSQRSRVLGRFEHSVIRNPVDHAHWRPFDRNLARAVLDLPLDERVLLTVAETAADHRKGADILHAALANFPSSRKFLWAAVGKSASGLAGARSLGFMADQRMLALAYAAADLFVLPSREDNLPNVIAESLCVGTPVVGLPAGGIPEMIDEGHNGTLGAAIDAGSLTEAILRADDTTFDREAIRMHAMRDYDPQRIAGEYSGIYESLLA